MIGGRHWSDTAVSVPFRRNERRQRVRYLNRILAHYELSLVDIGNTGSVLKGANGLSRLISNPSRLWLEVERATGRSCDPLDSRLIAALSHDKTFQESS